MDEIWNYIVNKMPGEIMVSLLIMFLISIIAIILGQAIKKADPTKPPKGLAFFADWLVDFSFKTIKSNLGNVYDFAAPYLIFLVTYIPMAFIASMFGLAAPMTYFTIPLCLAIVSWFGIQISAIVFQKIDYFKGFTSPLPTWLPIFVPINMLSKISPILSLSIRMFGNALAGSILMWLVYWATGSLSSLIIDHFNIFGLVIAPVLHMYFDVFSTFIQSLIFILLTMQLIAIEIPAPVNRRKKKIVKEEERIC